MGDPDDRDCGGEPRFTQCEGDDSEMLALMNALLFVLELNDGDWDRGRESSDLPLFGGRFGEPLAGFGNKLSGS